jgi:cysteine-rich repeat protein
MSNRLHTARRSLAAAFVLGASLLVAPRVSSAGGPPLGHVFIVVLENTLYSAVTPASMPYLTSLAAGGVTLDQMYAVDHASLTNYVAVTSGTEANALTRADCFFHNCVYEPPNDVNVADQLEGAGLTWKGYMESMPVPCAHGTEGSLDPYIVGYATRHNPFMYYRSIVGNPARCSAHDVPYTDLATDLAANMVPNYSFIVPNTCNDAHDGGASCGLDDADAWLSTHLPSILGSAAFADRGVLIVTFDESIGSDTTGCCGNSQGGHIATFVMGPLVSTPGGHTSTSYNHYSLLRTIEDGFGLPCLGHACDASITGFGPEVLTRCGNGMIDPGEDCDPGADVAGDCCSPSCLFETSGTACLDDALSCTTDTCDGAGVCSHAPNCDDADACTTDTCGPSGCSHDLLAGFAGAECRLDALIADVTGAGDIDAGSRARLLRPVTRAKDSVVRAEVLEGSGRAHSAARRLRTANRRLGTFEKLVDRLRARGVITATTGDRIRAEAEALVLLIGAL